MTEVIRLTGNSIRLLALCLLLVLTPCLADAQKKELGQARALIKSGKYDDADKIVTTLLKKPENRRDKRIWQVLYDAVRGKYEVANEKLYLKQKYDTAAFFNLFKQMVIVAETLDSLSPDQRKKLSQQQNAYRPNLFNGGMFFIRKSKWQEAFNFFETYIDAANQPLFEGYHYDSLDARVPQAAYWATFCGYKMKDPVLTLRHRNRALRDASKADFTLQFVAEARKWLDDDELYLATLQEGFRRFPEFHYFFPRLMDAYTDKGEYDRALAVADSALAVNDTSELFLFAKCTTLLRMERFEESIEYGEKILEINNNLPEPYYNIGMAYTNLAAGLQAEDERDKAKEAYQKARGYMENYREMMPDEKEKWAPALYRIYLNLNLGRQFDEIDRLLNN
ncbi:MAG: tetratricopeptide repeat protein [Prevotella sp.]|nr:tetratricopeptide repeat protein [Prevotella sp.]